MKLKIGDWCIIKSLSKDMPESLCRIRTITQSDDRSPYRVDIQDPYGGWLGFYASEDQLTPITEEVANIMRKNHANNI